MLDAIKNILGMATPPTSTETTVDIPLTTVPPEALAPFPYHIQIDVKATNPRELMVELFNIYQMYNSVNNPPMAAHDSAEHSWVVQYTAP